jgi:hypothetical protein
MTNEEKAARLRDMADAKKSKASVWREQSTSPSPWSGFTQRQCHEEGLRCEWEAAALLAGAEALEAVEVAKAALEQIVNNRIGDLGRCGSRHCDCSECVARAALARLEGE